jgi:glycosyltransferase involved in cell wall biosynthesis
MPLKSKILKKPRVAVIHPAIGKSLGGSQVFVLELTRRLKETCDITILSAKQENDLCKPVFSINRRDLSGFPFNLITKALKKFVSTPDIVIEHVTSFLPVLSNLLFADFDVIFPNNDWGGLLAASVAREIKGTPIIFTEHNGLIEKGKIASRNLSFKPDKYIALSEDFKFWVKKNYPQIDVEYIPNGVNFERFNPDIEPRKLDLPSPIILMVSRYDSNKRLELAMEAVSNLNKVSLLILSSGDNLDDLYKTGKTSLGDRFKLVKAEYNEMAGYYRACDVFTLPSVYEPFGLVYLEAMACNKPVVAPKDLTRTELIGDAGIFCDVRDPIEYANALERALETNFNDIPYRQSLKYSWENCADKYFEAIKSLTRKNLNYSKSLS